MAFFKKINLSARAALFAAFTALGGYLLIPLPFSPVPVTLQSLFTLLAGILLGSFAGFISQIVYLLVGIAGVPVFSGGLAGLGVIASPSGGYLLAFPIAAFITGKAKNKENLQEKLFYLILGALIINFSGALFLFLWWDFTVVQAAISGFVIYLPGETFKIFLIVLLIKKLPDNFLA